MTPARNPQTDRETIVAWGSTRCAIRYSDLVSDSLPTTSAHAYCFRDEALLVVRHQKRGIDIPGGHLDAGETPIQALTREVLEEASVTLDDVQPAGAVVVRQLDSGIATKYPALSQMRMYSALVRELLPFDSSRETLDRLFIPPRTLPQHHHAWNPAFQSVLEACIRDRIGEHAG